MTAKDIETKRSTLSETKKTLIMQYTNDELIERAENALESFLVLNKTIKYFRKTELTLTKAIPKCPTNSDKRLFKRCLDYAKCSLFYAELAMFELENYGGLSRESVNRLTSSINMFNKEYDRVIERSYEIIDLLENNKS